MADRVVKHLFEIRYTPLPTILDKRGQIAESLMDDLLDTWRIGQNRIEITSKENPNIALFFSYTNYGLGSESPNSSSLFTEKSKDLIKKAWNITVPQRYVRYGVRTTIFFPKKGSFENLVKKYTTKLTTFNEKMFQPLEGKLVDVGFPLNFVEENEKIRFNVVTGAMKKQQASEFFTNVDLLSEVGVFIDVDYFTETPTEIIKQQRDYMNFIDNAVKKAEKVQETILKIIDEEK